MLKIGTLECDNPVVLAPMAGVTNLAFRQICVDYGPGLYFNEMVSDQAINYRNERTLKMLETLDEERPIVFQLFGHDVKHMTQAAEYLDQFTNCDIIDINMGCPVNKIVKQGSGAALMKDSDAAAELFYAIKKVVKKPLTAKIRSGWDAQNINAVELSIKLEQAGASALFVHPRTRAQMYTGHSDWELIRSVKEKVNIPVVGNGDIVSGQDALDMMNQTKCDGVMIGRGLMGKPWLILECKNALENKSEKVEMTIDDRFELMKNHAQKLIALMGETNGMKQMRGHAAWGFNGLRHSRAVKQQLVHMKSYDEFVTILEEYKGSDGYE